MNNDIPLKFYDIADEYATEAAKPVSDTERDALAHYFQQLITRLMNNEEISEEAQQEMATKAGVDAQRIDDIAEFSIVGVTSSQRHGLCFTLRAN